MPSGLWSLKWHELSCDVHISIVAVDQLGQEQSQKKCIRLSSSIRSRCRLLRRGNGTCALWHMCGNNMSSTCVYVTYTIFMGSQLCTTMPESISSLWLRTLQCIYICCDSSTIQYMRGQWQQNSMYFVFPLGSEDIRCPWARAKSAHYFRKICQTSWAFIRWYATLDDWIIRMRMAYLPWQIASEVHVNFLEFLEIHRITVYVGHV